MPEILIAIIAFLSLPIVSCLLMLIYFSVIAGDINDAETGGGGWALIASVALVYEIGRFFDIKWSELDFGFFVISGMVVSYLALGVIWSFAKWYLKVVDRRDTYVALKKNYIARYELSENFLQPAPMLSEINKMTEDQTLARDKMYARNYDFVKEVRDTIRIVDHSSVISLSDTMVECSCDPKKLSQVIIPEISNFKSSILNWIMFWPVSFIWTMINDPLKKVVNHIYNKIKNLFQDVSNSIFSGI